LAEVAVVILNWNGTEFLQKFLPGVLKHSGDADIVVIDNGSNPSPVPALSITFPTIHWIELDRNYGFCEGYNRGLQQLSHPFWILLNSDVEVTPGWITPLVEQLKNTQVAACQPKVLQYNNRDFFEYAGASGGFIDRWGYPFCRGRLFDFCEQDQGQYNDPIPIFWATGAAMAVRSDVFKMLGGFDNTFFAHMEEIDLCWRMHLAGYSVYCAPSSVVYHVGGGTLSHESPAKKLLNYRNNLWMLYKHLPTGKVLTTIAVRLVLDGVAGIVELLKGHPRMTWAIIRAHFAFYGLALRQQVKRPTHFPSTIAKESIVWQHFILGKKKWNSLPS
jgi:hypothetical protein